MYGAPFFAVLLLVFYLAFPEVAFQGSAAVIGFLGWLYLMACAVRVSRRTDLTETQRFVVNASLPASMILAATAFWFASIDSFESLLSLPMVAFYVGIAWSMGIIAGILIRLTPVVSEDKDAEDPFFLQNFKEPKP
jgi:hypothetical protein